MRHRKVARSLFIFERRLAKTIDFIVKLEDMLKQSGYEDWEIRYFPNEKAYVLKFDGDTVLMRKVTGKENERTDI